MPSLRAHAAIAALLFGGGLVAAHRPAPTAAPRTAARATPPDSTGPRVVAANDSIAGEYLTVVGGCNDCHTESWDQTGGKTPPAERLAGSGVGYRGPWGTTYAANLRLVASRISEDRWVQILTTADSGHGRPPMPWMNTARMNDADLRAAYRYIKSLGPRGERTPRAVPPGREPTTPYIWMVPQKGGAGKAPSAVRGSAGP